MSNAKKKSFILYTDLKHTVDDLDDVEVSNFFRAILQYQTCGNIDSFDRMTKLLVNPLILQFQRDDDKWEAIRKKRVEAGGLGGKAKASKTKQVLASASKPKQNVANVAVTGNVTVNGNVTVRRKESDTSIYESIYQLYPKKVGKGAAIKAIEKACKTVSPDILKESVEAYAEAVGEWPASDKHFIPHPSTWFNQQCWDDDRDTWKRNNTQINGRQNGTGNKGFDRNAGTSNADAKPDYSNAKGNLSLFSR